MVTAKGSEIDTVVGLEVGADDYVTKPYRLRELVARMRAVLRRRPDRPVVATGLGEVLDGMCGRPRASRGRDPWRAVKLPLKEFELLEILLTNADGVLTRDTLIDRAWGTDYVGDTKTLDVHASACGPRSRRTRPCRRASSPSGASATSTTPLAPEAPSPCDGLGMSPRQGRPPPTAGRLVPSTMPDNGWEPLSKPHRRGAASSSSRPSPAWRAPTPPPSRATPSSHWRSPTRCSSTSTPTPPAAR